MPEPLAADSQAPPAAPLSGRKLYSPGAVAGYTLVTCLPVGYILYGLNLKARGQKALGISWALFGAAFLALVFVVPPRFAPATALMTGSATFGAISLFQLESRSFARARALGASRAKWWPPALVLLGVILLYYGVRLVIDR